MKKRSKETQTLRAGCSEAEPKIFAPMHTPSRGQPKFNQLELKNDMIASIQIAPVHQKSTLVDWCLMALSAQTGYIVP